MELARIVLAVGRMFVAYGTSHSFRRGSGSTSLSSGLSSQERMKISFALAVLLCHFLAASGLRAATYYVAKTGSDAAPGTQSQPFLTIQKAMKSAQPGDTVLLGVGSYAENVNSVRNGSSGSRIVLDGQNLASLQSINLNHSYQTIQNLTFPYSTLSYRFYFGQNGDFCIVSNNVIDGGFTNRQILMSWNVPDGKPFGKAGSDNLVISNTITRAGGTINLAAYGDRNLIKGNSFLNSDTGDWLRISGRSNTIVGNTFSNMMVTGIKGDHPDFFQVSGQGGYGSKGHIFERNIITKMEGQLVMMSGADNPDVFDFTFQNNIFVDVALQASIAARDVRWFNNIFLRCSSGTTLNFTVYTNALYTNFVYNSGHGGQVFNNVFLDCGPLTNKQFGWYGFDKRLTNIAADYNFVAKNNYQPVKQDTQERSIGDATGWDWWTWWEPHGINGGDPGFLSIPSLDFHLRARSILRNKGFLRPGLSVDFNGVARTNPPSIGAFEYVPDIGEPSAPVGLRTVP